ncbi:MAG TPA: hypothetical protein VF681_15365 [Abditibacteriaceae bacterium]|jgi:hypothetical protein
MKETDNFTCDTRATRQVTSGNPALESARINGTIDGTIPGVPRREEARPEANSTEGPGAEGTLPGDEMTATQEGEILSRRIAISHAHFSQGKPVARIARELGISGYLVRKTILDIRKEAREDYLNPATDALREALEQLDVLFGRHHEAWERSIAIADREELIEEGEAGDLVDGKRRIRITKSQKRRVPKEYNVRPLEGMLRCIETRAKLLGLYEKKVEKEVPANPLALMTLEQKAKKMGEILSRIAGQMKAGDLEESSGIATSPGATGGVSSNRPVTDEGIRVQGEVTAAAGGKAIQVRMI